MKNKKIIDAWNKIEPDSAADTRILNAILDHNHSMGFRRPRLHPAATLAASVLVICLCVAGYIFLMQQGTSDANIETAPPQPAVNSSTLPQDKNRFVLLTYTPEIQEDDTVMLREVDLVDQPDIWGGYYDGETELFYVNIGLGCKGENIINVEFSVNKGFFARQHIGDLKFDKDSPRLYVGAENRLVMVGTDFDIIGDTVILGKDEVTNDTFLFWGTEIEESEFYEILHATGKIDIYAKAMFSDSTTAERTISIDLSSGGAYTVSPSAAKLETDSLETEQRMELSEYYRSLPLEELELIPESVRPLTYDTDYNALYFDYEIDGLIGSTLFQDEYAVFDNDGVTRGAILGGEYLVVIKRGIDGEFTGMLYKLPT